jgi:hypothetical protein
VVVQLDEDEQLYARTATAWERLVARLETDRLDRQLARGASPERSVTLALRAQRLARSSTRDALAGSLRRLMSLATSPTARVGGPLPISRQHILEAREDLDFLAETLVAPIPVAAQGVAQVKVLLQDASGPLYRDSARTDLRSVVREAVRALEPQAQWGLGH